MADETTAPGRLGLVEDFINTADLSEPTEILSSPAALKAWVSERGLGDLEAGPEALAKALALREALRRLALANNGGPAYPVDHATLNRLAADAQIQLRFTGSGVRLEPRAEGVDGVLGRLIVIVQAEMADGSWQRLKGCPAAGCGWAFFDRSKNHSGTWCSMKTCGNRAKASRYRERKRG